MKKILLLAIVLLGVIFGASITRAGEANGAAAAGQASITPVPLFTISEGSQLTLGPTTGPTPIAVGTTGYSDALLSINKTRAYKFKFLGCGDTVLDNRFYVRGAYGGIHHFDCDTSKIGDHFIANLNKADVPHSPFYFQAGADDNGPSVFNGEGPFDGTYTNGDSWSNTSIFYAIEGSTAAPGETSGDVVLLGLSDGGVLNDVDHQDMVIRISRP